jgi:hypothetical protein
MKLLLFWQISCGFTVTFWGDAKEERPRISRVITKKSSNFISIFTLSSWSVGRQSQDDHASPWLPFSTTITKRVALGWLTCASSSHRVSLWKCPPHLVQAIMAVRVQPSRPCHDGLDTEDLHERQG